MGVFRSIYLLAKGIMMLFAMWEAFTRTRWFAAGFLLWRIFRPKPVRNVPRTAVFQFVNANEPAIYRRLGLRKIIPARRTPRV